MSNIFETRLKIYPNGTSEYIEFKKGITYVNGQKSRKSKGIKKDSQLFLEDSVYLPTRSSDDLRELQKLARRKSKVRDYVLSGNFSLFGTLTFAPEHASDTLDDVFRKKMILFTRMLRRRGIRYYIVSERHKSGMIHLHALFSDNLPTEHSRASRRYLTIPLWSWGFSSVSFIRDQVATAHYVTKYVSKEAMPGRSVWVSQGLIRPQVLYNSPDLLTPIVSEWYGENVNITIRSR